MKYRYTLDPSNNQIDILELDPVTRKGRGPFSCIGCGREMIAAQGKKQEWHFRHKHEDASFCSGETYLHRLGKRSVVEGFRQAVSDGKPYLMTRRIEKVCRKWEKIVGRPCREFEDVAYDLTDYYDRADEESIVGGFRADVLLSHSEKKRMLLVEIKVTHGCAQEKKISGLKIVEIAIDSEQDAVALKRGINLRNENLRVYGFKKAVKPMECRKRCDASVLALFIYRPLGNVCLEYKGLSEFIEIAQSESTIRAEVVGTDELLISKDSTSRNELPNFAPRSFIQKLRGKLLRANRSGAAIKNCLLCKNVSTGTLAITPPDLKIFCQARNRSLCQSEAASCEMYRPER